jgi:hypothetical protein
MNPKLLASPLFRQIGVDRLRSECEPMALKPDRGRTGTGWVHPLYPIDLHRAASLESRLRRAIALNQQSAQPAFRQDDLP